MNASCIFLQNKLSLELKWVISLRVCFLKIIKNCNVNTRSKPRTINNRSWIISYIVLYLQQYILRNNVRTIVITYAAFRSHRCNLHSVQLNRCLESILRFIKRLNITWSTFVLDSGIRARAHLSGPRNNGAICLGLGQIAVVLFLRQIILFCKWFTTSSDLSRCLIVTMEANSFRVSN